MGRVRQQPPGQVLQPRQGRARTPPVGHLILASLRRRRRSRTPRHVTGAGNMTESENSPSGKRRLFRLELGPHRVERDVDTELAFHIDMRIRRLVERGMDPATARAQALRQFGDWDTVRAEMLDIDYQQEKTVKRANFLAELRQDTLYAMRSLRNNLGFALVIVLSLAVGIGANTAI